MRDLSLRTFQHFDPSVRRVLGVLLFVLVAHNAGSCGNDGVGVNGDVVGGPCLGAADCEEACLRDGDFPNGSCSVPCGTDAHCPPGTFCIRHDGQGWCVLGCVHPSDCRAGYTCKGQDNNGHAGESLVCVNN